MVALPTAAMVCWQVGALEEARAYVAEALPLHGITRSIARVVLLSAAAGVALADGDIDAAVEFGATADREAGELGVEREVPLIRAVLARALLARDDLPGAVRCAAAVLGASQGMLLSSPLALGLETAAMVLHAAGLAGDRALGEFLATAALLRRPVIGPPPPLSPGPSPSCGPSSDRNPRPPTRSRSPSPLPAPLPCSPARRLRDMAGS